MKREEIRALVRGAYDIQKLRIQMGNRVVGNFKAKLGQKPGEKEETLEKEAQDILRRLRSAYKLLTDGVKSFPRGTSFKGDEVISSFTELCLVAQYEDLLTSEEKHFRRLGSNLASIPIWSTWLVDVRGVGPAMAGVLISEIDIHAAKYASSVWKYAGLDVAPDGKGRSRRKEHLVKAKYTDAQGEIQERDSIAFNPFLKTKLMGVLSGSFLRAGETKEFCDSPTSNPYAKAYRDYKHRLESRPDLMEVEDKAENKGRKGHRHNMALRYMIKLFLVDYYKKARALEGLEVFDPYAEAKLGLKHAGAA